MSNIKEEKISAKIIYSVFVGTYVSSGLFVLIGFGFAIIISGAVLMGAPEAPSTIHIATRIGHHGAIATVIAQLGIYLACALGAKFPKVRKVWAGLGAILTAVILIAFLNDEISLLN